MKKIETYGIKIDMKSLKEAPLEKSGAENLYIKANEITRK